MKPTRKTLAGIAGSAALITGGVDVAVLNETPIERVEIIAEERVEAMQNGNVVETRLPWKGQQGLTVKYDMGAPTMAERLADERTKQVITETVNIDDGGFKVDVILSERPDTNRFCYAIEGWQEYDFWYQPPLTPEEIAEGAERPDNVVGSYAVYHKTLKDFREGGVNYATGKVMHIYRPEVWEVNNPTTTREWAELSYEDGELCVTARQEFLDNATYPVRIDPTFGYTTVGATAGSANLPGVFRFQAPADAVSVESITVHLRDSTGDFDFSTTIYTDNSNDADALGEQEAATSTVIASTAAWYTQNLASSYSVTGGDYYWLGRWMSQSANYYYDAGATGQYTTNSAAGSFNNWPDPFNNNFTFDRIGSIYATYTSNDDGVGDRYVREHQAARGTTANTSAADITYDTQVISDGSNYTYSAPGVDVAEAGNYLAMFDIGQVDFAQTRGVGTLVPRINGTTDQTVFRATHRYTRNSGGAQEAASFGTAILELSAGDDVSVRNPGVLTPTDSFGNYGTNANFGGGLQLLRLPDNGLTHVQRTVDAAEVGTSNINTTRPWIDTSGTWTKITYNSEVTDDDGLYSGSGGDITLAANTKYLIVWGATIYSTDGSRHTNVTRLVVDGDNVQSSSGYHRNVASQGTPMNGMYLHEVDGTADTVYLEATHETEGGDAGTPQVSDAYLQVIELPSTAEWIHVDNGATDSLTTALNGITTWYDTPLSSTFRADGDSNLSLDAANNAVQNDSGSTLPVFAIGWHRWDRDSGASGVRKNPWTSWDNNGTILDYGVAGAYSRGQQGTDDNFQAHYVAGALMDLANAGDLAFRVQDEASATQGDMGIYASTNRHFLGVQVLNLESIEGGGGGEPPASGGIIQSIFWF